MAALGRESRLMAADALRILTTAGWFVGVVRVDAANPLFARRLASPLTC